MTYYERRLPHWHPEGKALFVTWRLHGSLPAEAWSKRREVLADLASNRARTHGLESPRRRKHGTSAGRQFAHLDRLLDKSRLGPMSLTGDKVAGEFVSILHRGDSELNRYRLHAFVVMPNHVHILIEPLAEPVKLLQGIKGASGRKANLILGRVGKPFWQDESFDRWVRNAAEFEKIRRYIERNPVSAGLVASPRDWPWSSASRGAGFPARAPLRCLSL